MLKGIIEQESRMEKGEHHIKLLLEKNTIGTEGCKFLSQTKMPELVILNLSNIETNVRLE